MYIIIWPEERFVLNRIIKVNGRIIWEKISIRGKNSISPIGDPYGNICEKNPRKSEKQTQNKRGIQKSILIESVTL